MKRCPTCGQLCRLVNLSFGARLRLIRAERNLTAREAAEHCEMPQTTYSALEARETFPEEKIINKLSNGLELPLVVLLGIETNSDPRWSLLDELETVLDEARLSLLTQHEEQFEGKRERVAEIAAELQEERG